MSTNNYRDPDVPPVEPKPPEVLPKSPPPELALVVPNPALLVAPNPRG
jgi:hypothetical protein